MCHVLAKQVSTKKAELSNVSKTACIYNMCAFSCLQHQPKITSEAEVRIVEAYVAMRADQGGVATRDPVGTPRHVMGHDSHVPGGGMVEIGPTQSQRCAGVVGTEMYVA
jgi:hypothetical protein